MKIAEWFFSKYFRDGLKKKERERLHKEHLEAYGAGGRLVLRTGSAPKARDYGNISFLSSLL